MSKFNVYAVVTATKYIGEFEAETKEEAEQMAWESEDAYVSVCHQCANEVDGAEIERMVVEEESDE
ncbi:hypothetical protein PU629_06260 [Pullulanibacillus sp. KACC 23026]|uniref:hypothetical protein n=1 Tax=Pullulanibacillus sp. KACC 23026 TaxID=3028315 RepID=UPI0023B043C4|nr:hypothetical protein [Pullulanibacillus sp. KACC 23026]WEG13967.1 hypothetical protein PU629_06260 [Pullulanibacillus sp. KACC 23026]